MTTTTTANRAGSVSWEIYVGAEREPRLVEAGEADSVRHAVEVLAARVPVVEPAAPYAYGAVHRDGPPGDAPRALRANRLPGGAGICWSG